MRQPIRADGCAGRRAPRTCAIGVGAVLGLALAGPACADLAPAFAGKVSVDAGYVTGASQATDIAFSGDGRAVVTRKSGEIVVRRANGTLNVVAYPFGGTLDTGSEKGLLGVVADPDVAQNNAFYFYVSNGPTNDRHRVYRAVLTASDALTKPDSFIVDANPIVAASRNLGPGLEGPANHDGGGMVIHNGQLYIGVGDTGSNASPPVNKYGSCLNKGNGKILRVNLDGSLADGNPLSGLSSVTACSTPTGAWTTAAPDRRIFAWGLRNPWRLWIDPLTGLLWVGDVGEGAEEEISVGGGDQHYGYPFVEGARVWGNVAGNNCQTMTPSRQCTAPVYSYSTSSPGAVTGGLILDSCTWPDVFGGAHYVFGDSSKNWIRALPVNADRTGVASSTAVELGSWANGRPVSIRMGPDRSLYVVFLGLGAVYRFTPTAGCGAPVADAQVPVMPAAAMGLLMVALAASAIWIQRRQRGGARTGR